MSLSSAWDDTYRAGAHMSIWPWSDLVSYVYRYAKPGDGFSRVLELGCGAGANIPLFRKLGADYYAVEGSSAIVARLHEEYPDLRSRVIVGDFTCAIPFDGVFDTVVDRASLTHNPTADIRRTLAMLFERIRSGGKYIGIDWFSDRHSDAREGSELDSHTRTGFNAGQFVGVGAVHFSDREHLVGLLAEAGFTLERLEHKLNEIVVPATHQFGAWNFVAARP